jgi:hypothetical protein
MVGTHIVMVVVAAAAAASTLPAGTGLPLGLELSSHWRLLPCFSARGFQLWACAHLGVDASRVMMQGWQGKSYPSPPPLVLNTNLPPSCGHILWILR